MREDVTQAIKSFTSGKLLKEVNHTFVTLVPKNASPSSLSDYRHLLL